MTMIRGNIRANGVEFAHWFNNTVLPKHEYHFRSTFAKNCPANRISPTAINNLRVILNSLKLLSGKEETPINEWVAYFLLFYNETGATFTPISEIGDDWYFFERGLGTTMTAVYGNTMSWKASYNNEMLGNELAGNQLARKGIISSQSDITLWNGQNTYPKDQPQNVKMEARNCDFYRFRGRGLIQTTGKGNYKQTVESLLNGASIDNMTDAQLAELFKRPDIYLGAVRNFYKSRQYAVERAILGDFDDIAYVTAGNNQQYIVEFVARANAIVSELKGAVIENIPPIDSAIFTLSRQQAITLQKNLSALSADIKAMIDASGGCDGIVGKATIDAFIKSSKKVSDLI